MFAIVLTTSPTDEAELEKRLIREVSIHAILDGNHRAFFFLLQLKCKHPCPVIDGPRRLGGRQNALTTGLLPASENMYHHSRGRLWLAAPKFR